MTTTSTFVTSLTIDGQELPGEGEWLESVNPTTGETIARLRAASQSQVDDAVAAARRAFDDGPWPQMRPAERSAAMGRLADALDNHIDEFLRLIVDEVGTPVNLARTMQTSFVQMHMRHFAELAARDLMEELGVVEGPPFASVSIVAYRPAGVVVAIPAYNYPLLLSMVKVGAALAAGCTVVLLTADRALLTTLLIGELVREAGLPGGVVNVVAGGAETGRQLTTRTEVDRISFTGSVAVGQAVMRQSADTLAGLVFELGGKSANILTPGFELTPESVGPHHLRYLRNAGQGCASPTRLIVHEDAFDRFVEISREVFATVPVGDPWDEATITGPVITAMHKASVDGFVERAIAAGGQILAGGGTPAFEHGWWVNPTLIGGVGADSEIAQEEIFGPIGVVLTYKTVEEAIAIANSTKYGLAAYVQAPTSEEALEIAPRLRAGTVYINGGGPMRADVPFGGFKSSGVGREWGALGVREYLEPQHIQWPVLEPLPITPSSQESD